MIVNIHSALVGIGYGLLVLFFAIGIFSSAASFRELQRPEFALRHFIRFVLAKVAVGRGMELMTAIFSICGSVVSASMSSIGGAISESATLPSELVSAKAAAEGQRHKDEGGKTDKERFSGLHILEGRKRLESKAGQ